MTPSGWVINGVIAIAPVLAMLMTLRLLDSFKLVSLPLLLWMLFWGGASAIAAYGVGIAIQSQTAMEFTMYSRYCAPLIEETLKAVPLLWLIRRHRVGFAIDAAILGFALGAGFALIENSYYLLNNSLNLGVWLVRGFGTAVMHGGVTAIVGITVLAAIDQRQRLTFAVVAPGLLIAIVIHSVFNHFFLAPLISALAVFWVVPLFLVWIFKRSTQTLNAWLEDDFEGDMALIEQLDSNTFNDTRVGQFLTSLRAHYDPMMIVDILCYLRLYTELSMRAKGLMIMREQGFQQPPANLTGHFTELRHLETQLGNAVLLSLAPLLQSNRRDLWHLKMLEQESAAAPTGGNSSQK